jgi:hypothetical protein
MTDNTGKHLLSKSTFIRGVQCAKSLYLNKFSPDLRDPMSEAQEAIFSHGTDVGKIVQGLFPGGIDVSPESYTDFSESLAKTRELIGNGVPVIYEAAFQFEGVLAAIDILVNDKGKWKAYEVKSSTQVSDTHILDVSLQYYVMTHAGLAIDDISIVHINNQYVKDGSLDLNSLFAVESLLDTAKDNQVVVKNFISEFKKILTGKKRPVMTIGKQCDNPYACDFSGHCWKDIPEESVFDLTRLKSEKKFKLYDDGIVLFKDIPGAFPFTPAQRIQVDCSLSRKTHINKPGIKDFLDTVKYPLYFLDFETFMPAIPLYDGMRPYQHVVFQYSLHFKKSKNATAVHSWFLGDGKTDPREALVRKLLEETATDGRIIVYNQSFEQSRLRELADNFPAYGKQVEERIVRLKDLMTPFMQKLYYSPEMRGSASIKSVLPALVPGMSYDGLAIGNGEVAMSSYENLYHEKDDKRREEVRRNLLEYCQMDTLAMVKILEVLEGVGV